MISSFQLDDYGCAIFIGSKKIDPVIDGVIWTKFLSQEPDFFAKFGEERIGRCQDHRLEVMPF
jgi:hypothetical protein